MQNRVKWFRQRNQWSQEELARRAGISRAAVSAIEIHRLVPSVGAALALAKAFQCQVEDLFLAGEPESLEPTWAWPVRRSPCRFWQARVNGRWLCYPAEPLAQGLVAQDGVFRDGRWETETGLALDQTLVMASCDPAASLLAQALFQSKGLRLLVFPRSSRQALDLLRQGLVDLAGLHLAGDQEGNRRAARDLLSAGYSLLRYARWEEGLALGSAVSATSVRGLLRTRLRWVGRAEGSGARRCQDAILEHRAAPDQIATDHHGVVEAIRSGWAEVGVCPRLVCEDRGVRFLSVQDEAYDLCFRTAFTEDPRFRAFWEVCRSASLQSTLGQLPGFQPNLANEWIPVE